MKQMDKKALLSDMWLILSYTVQLVISDVCTVCQAVAEKCLTEKYVHSYRKGKQYIPHILHIVKV